MRRSVGHDEASRSPKRHHRIRTPTFPFESGHNFFFLIRRQRQRCTSKGSSAASDVYKGQGFSGGLRDYSLKNSHIRTSGNPVADKICSHFCTGFIVCANESNTFIDSFILCLNYISIGADNSLDKDETSIRSPLTSGTNDSIRIFGSLIKSMTFD